MDAVLFAVFNAFSYLNFLYVGMSCYIEKYFFLISREISGFPEVSLLLIYTTPEQAEDTLMGRVHMCCLCFSLVAG